MASAQKIAYDSGVGESAARDISGSLHSLVSGSQPERRSEIGSEGIGRRGRALSKDTSESNRG